MRPLAAIRQSISRGSPHTPGPGSPAPLSNGAQVQRCSRAYGRDASDSTIGRRCRQPMLLPIRWIAAHRGSLRLRLTAVFGLMFFIASSAVLAATALLVVRYWHFNFAGASPVVNPHDMNEDMLWMLKWGSLVVTCVGLSATALGWVVAGRLLQPLTHITHTAERIAGRTLHRRISLEAPPGEIKSLADSFDRMLERLDESFAGQGRFIANAAHELKTPLALNRTLVEVAMNRHDATAPLRHLGEDLLKVNARQERLIDALLALARSDSGTVERLPTDLRLVAEAVLDAAAASAREAGIALCSDLGVAPLQGDPTLLEQLARNLVDNAIRHNHHGGAVRVITRVTPEAAVLTVTNTGPTIAPHEVPTLFQPFRRLTDRVASAKGSGLGLSIVQAIAHTHDGEANATPHPEGGLTITVTLPHRSQDQVHQPR